MRHLWTYFALWMILTVGSVQAVNLVWKPSPDPRMKTVQPSGYVLVWGYSSRNYQFATNVGNVECCSLNVTPGTTNYISVFAFAGSSLQSDLANEVVWIEPHVGPSNLRIVDFK